MLRAFLLRSRKRDLLERVRGLPFKEFEFQGFVGKRRVVSFGWKYDFNERQLQKAGDMPPFLLPLRDTGRPRFAGLTPADFQHVLVTEYFARGGESGGTGTRRCSTRWWECRCSHLVPSGFAARRGRSGRRRP